MAKYKFPEQNNENSEVLNQSINQSNKQASNLYSAIGVNMPLAIYK
jgi:hypothetical protein